MNLLNCAIFVLLIAGHTELIVTAINRLHSGRHACVFLKWTRRIHDLVIVLFPLALIWRVGLVGPALLTGGSWRGVSPGWTIYLALCVLGFVGLCASTIRWQTRRPPSVLLAQSSEIVNVAERLGRKPIGTGRYQSLARCPGNESFQVELSQKEFRAAGLPKSCDGLRLLHLSDLHFFGTIGRDYFDQVFDRLTSQSVDLIALTGDLFDNLELLDWLTTTLARLQAPLGCHYILGNHDWYLQESLIRDELRSLGWNDVAAAPTIIDHRGGRIVLAGDESPWMGRHAEFPAREPRDFRILLSHTPDNLAIARRQQVDLMLSGHNHGGQIVLPLIGPVYSPSRFGVKYAGGTFFESPTLLHVSRGLSGRYPLRWNCLPEATTITLRSVSGPNAE